MRAELGLCGGAAASPAADLEAQLAEIDASIDAAHLKTHIGEREKAIAALQSRRKTVFYTLSAVRDTDHLVAKGGDPNDGCPYEGCPVRMYADPARACPYKSCPYKARRATAAARGAAGAAMPRMPHAPHRVAPSPGRRCHFDRKWQQ